MGDPNETLNQGQTGAGGAASPPAQEGQAVDLKSLNKDQLLEYSGKIGAKAKPAMNKDEIIHVIEDFEKAREADGGQPPADETQGQTGAEGAVSPPAQEGDNTPVKEKDDTPVGTIRVVDGVEVVNVGAGWVPTIRENIASDKPAVVISKKRAGKTIFAKTGNPITFDKNGRATVCAVDALYLKSIVIDEVHEYTVEGNE
jgi:hypothetical protein